MKGHGVLLAVHLGDQPLARSHSVCTCVIYLGIKPIKHEREPKTVHGCFISHKQAFRCIAQRCFRQQPFSRYSDRATKLEQQMQDRANRDFSTLTAPVPFLKVKKTDAEIWLNLCHTWLNIQEENITLCSEYQVVCISI